VVIAAAEMAVALPGVIPPPGNSVIAEKEEAFKKQGYKLLVS
jgi:hypothetical protein